LPQELCGTVLSYRVHESKFPCWSYFTMNATLDEGQSRLLSALTITVAQRLGDDTMMVEEDNSVRSPRMARVDDIVLLDHPADATGPRSINVYRVDVRDFASGNDRKFKLDPQCLLYSLHWQHNGTAPDLHLQLVRDPQPWFDRVGSSLLGALIRHDPQLCDRLRAATAS
jgi:hypothetical protein